MFGSEETVDHWIWTYKCLISLNNCQTNAIEKDESPGRLGYTLPMVNIPSLVSELQEVTLMTAVDGIYKSFVP